MGANGTELIIKVAPNIRHLKDYTLNSLALRTELWW